MQVDKRNLGSFQFVRRLKVSHPLISSQEKNAIKDRLEVSLSSIGVKQAWNEGKWQRTKGHETTENIMLHLYQIFAATVQQQLPLRVHTNISQSQLHCDTYAESAWLYDLLRGI
ncbi:uncharacterized protein MCYG_05755 [Microsporum canis CBS 113480]|uniref:Uncharacterized protein n=1 Tax=Arthroderma otae (strain ATCC MYA-4605 / CBS 113480) TaxID=554155 RepID=C5FST3_ARTOC|nr:uncharacterized protein MCYG_05755 [Microsporum canis CBS 113480]EEQ32936.1 predicted protein [Microsporum canis CBS 113480]